MIMCTRSWPVSVVQKLNRIHHCQIFVSWKFLTGYTASLRVPHGRATGDLTGELKDLVLLGCICQDCFLVHYVHWRKICKGFQGQSFPDIAFLRLVKYKMGTSVLQPSCNALHAQVLPILPGCSHSGKLELVLRQKFGLYWRLYWEPTCTFRIYNLMHFDADILVMRMDNVGSPALNRPPGPPLWVSTCPRFWRHRLKWCVAIDINLQFWCNLAGHRFTIHSICQEESKRHL